MTKTEVLNKLARDPEERLLLARVLDKLETTRLRSIPSVTQFLSLGQQASVEQLLASQGHPKHQFWGGVAECDRKVCVFLPDWLEFEDWLEDECPLTAVRISAWRESELTHRDFLGSLVGLGITREKLGDLFVEETTCDVVLLKEVESALLTQLDQVGRQKVKVAPQDVRNLVPPQATVTVKRDTVATLRLDAVAASGFSTSRGKMSGWIGSKKVQVNGKECDKADRMVQEGDVLVCRGLGKCVLKEVAGTSKKGRVMVVIERYV